MSDHIEQPTSAITPNRVLDACDALEQAFEKFVEHTIRFAKHVEESTRRMRSDAQDGH